ncbi:MAG: tyrosine-type recombinase/integrase [Candidatus Marinimicrobia bacterium]|jgi:integrase|nr:tyrosine-type recombinase/integrase [Candidatus Neomarinimicrobiota bacterium]MBT4784188.1 tyrosine-type recombinase/integrase [Candidatus Neomarinimicrobiota bacterium]MBT6797333.1 tyrosine-type recombinase/integrase [Candidatus Neomarinimicrobiota bacterium]MBT7944996.1 tyrosine-type recombinase/integrase [Candidatus Neomarinimicrobiota bacterium]
MATLRKRRKLWYARVRWYEKNDPYQKEKMIPLRTPSKVEAMERLSQVNKVVADIKEGMVFSFPWLTDSKYTTVKRFTLLDAVKQYGDHRSKLGLRPKTMELNNGGIDHFLRSVGANLPLEKVDTDHILLFIGYLKARGLSITTINIHLRTISTMFRYYQKIGMLNKVPLIEQRRVDNREPKYITDSEFQSIKELEGLDDLYKRLFFFYRETGLRLRETSIAELSGRWLDIPCESKTHSERHIELDDRLLMVYAELMEWVSSGYGSRLKTPFGHISKKFKQALRNIGADEKKNFHSLRHTFAVRSLIKGVSIYELKLLMGHSSVTTTECYSNINLKRVSQDFPTLASKEQEAVKLVKRDTVLRDTRMVPDPYLA